MGLTPNTHIRVFPIGVAPTGSRYFSRVYFTLFGLTFSYSNTWVIIAKRGIHKVTKLKRFSFHTLFLCVQKYIFVKNYIYV